MIKKEMIAMLLAGGQGSRLGVLTEKVAKPAVAFGGKYRIIDFPLSNCINSGIDTVGVLTQYQPLRLNTHIGIGIPWDLDRNEGGVTVLPPYEKSTSSEWYTGTANAIYQNLAYMEQYNPDYVLILSGDHIYKMNYAKMLDDHIQHKADATIAVIEVPMKEASRFGIMNTDGNGRIVEFDATALRDRRRRSPVYRRGNAAVPAMLPVAAGSVDRLPGSGSAAETPDPGRTPDAESGTEILDQRHPGLQHVQYLPFQLFRIDRLGHVTVETVLHHFLLVRRESEGGDSEHGHVGRYFTDLARGFVTVHHRHIEIHQHQVRPVLFE